MLSYYPVPFSQDPARPFDGGGGSLTETVAIIMFTFIMAHITAPNVHDGLHVNFKINLVNRLRYKYMVMDFHFFIVGDCGYCGLQSHDYKTTNL